MKSLAIAMFLPACLFGQFVNKSIDYGFDYPDKVKSVVRTSVKYEIDAEDTVYQHTTILTCRFDEKGEYTYYQTTENGDLLYEMQQRIRDNGRTVIRYYKGLNMDLDSIVAKLDEKGNKISETTYYTGGKLTVNNYQYDKNGNKTVHSVNQRDSVITRKYAYDKENRVVTETEFRKPIKGGKELKFNELTHAYNAAGMKTMDVRKYYSAGNTVVTDTTIYTYTAQNKLATRTYSNGKYSATNTFTYDGSGNMVREDFSTTEELDYDASMAELWTFDQHGYWSSYTQKVDYQEVGATYETVYSPDGLPVSCTMVDLGTISKVTWEYEYR